MEHRAFLTNALLEAAGTDVWAPAELVVEVVESLTAQRSRLPGDGRGLQRPLWPGDDLAATHARRDPWNDARDDDDPEWYAIYLDLFGRMGRLTEPSYQAWCDLLTEQDKTEAGTAGFIDFMEARIFDREQRDRARKPGDSPGQGADLAEESHAS